MHTSWFSNRGFTAGSASLLKLKSSSPLVAHLLDVVKDVDHISDPAGRLLDLGGQVNTGHSQDLENNVNDVQCLATIEVFPPSQCPCVPTS